MAGHGNRQYFRIARTVPSARTWSDTRPTGLEQPEIDASGREGSLVVRMARQKLDDLPMADLGQPPPNSRFAGNGGRLPFSGNGH